MSTGLTRRRTGTRRMAELAHDVESLRLRAAINRIVGRDVSAWVNDDDASPDLTVEDVAQHWLARPDGDPQALDGPDGFWSQYANRVEGAPAESGNDYRAEFCATSVGGGFDDYDYFHAVWAAHVSGLRAAATDIRTAS